MTTTTTFRSIAAAAIAAAALGLAACGGDGEDPASAGGDPQRRGDNKDAMLAYAQCMRDQGIDFPDPKPGGGPQIVEALGDANPEKLRDAEEACKEHREQIKPPELSEEQEQEFKDAALAHARCMREQGIDFPDPVFGSDGGAQVRLGKGGIDPTDPKFRAAQEACEDEMPALGGGGAVTEEAP